MNRNINLAQEPFGTECWEYYNLLFFVAGLRTKFKTGMSGWCYMELHLYNRRIFASTNQPANYKMY